MAEIGADFKQYKNMVGAFHQPLLVYTNVSVLKTLPDTEFSSGMGEVIKHGLIRDKDYNVWLYSAQGRNNAERKRHLPGNDLQKLRD